MIWVRFPLRAEIFSLRHRIQTDSGAYPPSYRMGNWTFLPEYEEAVRGVELYLHSLISLHGVVLG